MIANINVGCDPARVQHGKDSFFVAFDDNGQIEYEFFGTVSAMDSFRKALESCKERQGNIVCRRVGLKVQCPDADGIRSTFLYDLKTGEQLSESYLDFYNLLTNIKQHFPNYMSYPRKLQAWI